MIVDTSALVASLYGEAGADRIDQALLAGTGLLPAPVVVELHRVTSDDANLPDPDIVQLVEKLIAGGYQILPFDEDMTRISVEANVHYGSGNGRGGRLNMLDLMVYAAAKARDMPILCTGNDFSLTDAKIHPASRAG